MKISKEEILKCIKKLKNNKACGEDLVINEYIKSTTNTFIDIKKIIGIFCKTFTQDCGKKFSETAKYCNWPIIFWIHFITFVFVDGFYITHKPVIRNNARFENNIK
jgi:hypothetical protein